ncbi:phospho-sugar mutase [Corynebacterium mendelii]|uniref:Phospho-sugar mutase n=1 Tax=Corynebacterium mendelii TaxID=2765362 RepID=A0A939E3X8_9CORY|nr:phospho-sugar mutase [Corynebacterium mendelii]MBN9645162.1 phospho-sugar mutase [Corynebacterium mendelii]
MITDPHCDDVVARATDWAEHDPDDDSARFVKDLVDTAHDDPAARGMLEQMFSGPLTFGTAGLRGEVGPGEHRMNRATVIKATKGLVDWLTARVANPVVVIGCDARHGSHAFAHDAAAVVAAAGGTAILLEEQLPTPVTAFAVRYLNADAGVMVTASHNPPADNGYKVYLGGRIATGDGRGVQLISPADKEIQRAIAAAGPADAIERDYSSVTRADVLEAYLARAGTLGEQGPDKEAKNNLRLVLTPMHGVGGRTAVAALARAGYHDVHLVGAQAYPDPDFPTVSFPNPEEPGALDLAVAAAEKVAADVIIALDPDADRCAVAIPVPDAHTGDTAWTQLSGDETGALLGDWVLSHTTGGGCASSLVSSRWLAAIAKGHGRGHTQTLTGFKWIARSPGIVFGYEEAIGFCCDPEFVRDKDGVCTAVTVANYAATLKQRGAGLVDELNRLRDDYGFYQTRPLTFRVTDLSLIDRTLDRLLDNPPTRLAGSQVVHTHDLSTGYNGLPPTTGLVLFTADNDRVIIRPSGTEPKLKCYLEVVIGNDQPRPGAAAQRRLERIAGDLTAAIGLGH